MWSYILRRLMLMVPTMLGITVIAFFVMQVASKNAYEAEKAMMQGGGEVGEAGAGTGSGLDGQAAITLEQDDALRRSYELHLPILLNTAVQDRSDRVAWALDRLARPLPDVDSSALRQALERVGAADALQALDEYESRALTPGARYDLDAVFVGRYVILLGALPLRDAAVVEPRWEDYRHSLDARIEARKDKERARLWIESAGARLAAETLPRWETFDETSRSVVVPLLARLPDFEGLDEEDMLGVWRDIRDEYAPEALREDAAALISGQGDVDGADNRVRARRSLYAAAFFNLHDSGAGLEERQRTINYFEMCSGADTIPFIETLDEESVDASWDEARKWWRKHDLEFVEIGSLDRVLRTFTETRYGGWLNDILHGDFRRSRYLGVPVLEAISSRLPISVQFGLTGFLLSYLVCIPLGVAKAVRHNSTFDVETSFLVFIGYSIPGWALGAILLMLFATDNINITLPYFGTFDLPLYGFQSENYEQMDFWGQVGDRVRHAILPVIAYAAGSFATLTVLMKNSLMENLGADYVRTAFAKGLTERRVIFVHALRNSLIPLCTGLGHMLSILLAGSYLIEMIFTIDGFGYMGFKALINNDINLLMGVLVIGSLLKLWGNLFSDILYSLTDPRIRFT